jgi:archaellum component FlaF (FlaF/FlaG flagellin family)
MQNLVEEELIFFLSVIIVQGEVLVMFKSSLRVVRNYSHELIQSTHAHCNTKNAVIGVYSYCNQQHSLVVCRDVASNAISAFMLKILLASII